MRKYTPSLHPRGFGGRWINKSGSVGPYQHKLNKPQQAKTHRPMKRNLAIGAAVVGVAAAGTTLAAYKIKNRNAITPAIPIPQGTLALGGNGPGNLQIKLNTITPGHRTILQKLTGLRFIKGTPYTVKYDQSELTFHLSDEFINGTRGYKRPVTEYIAGKPVRRGPIPSSVSTYYSTVPFSRNIFHVPMHPDTVAYNEVKQRFVTGRSFVELDPKTLKPLTGEKLRGIGF